MNVRESYSRVLEQRTLGGRRWQTNGGLIFLPLEMEVSFPHAILDPLALSPPSKFRALTWRPDRR